MNIYNDLVRLLSLDKGHEDSLLERGFTSDEIILNQYKTLQEDSEDLIEELKKNHTNFSYPGFYQIQKGKVKLNSFYGLAIPIRGYNGDITGIKIRTASKNVGKYIWLSSKEKVGGLPAEATCHFPLYKKGKDLKTVRITEGEFKADYINKKLNEYTISIPGVNVIGGVIDALLDLPRRPETVIISLDSDKFANTTDYDIPQNKESDLKNKGSQQQANNAVTNCLVNLYIRLVNYGYKVIVEDWDYKFGKGIDDLYKNGNITQLRHISRQRIRDKIRKINKVSYDFFDWCYINEIERFANLTSGDQHRTKYFQDAFKKYFPTKDSIHPFISKEKYIFFMDKVDYIPLQRQFLYKDNCTFFNLWRPSKYSFRTLGKEEKLLNSKEYQKFLDNNLFDKHLYTLCNKDYDDYNALLGYLAFNIQRQGEKTRWAFLLQGTQGCGKGVVKKIMTELLGEQNVSIPTNKIMHEKYDSWQIAKQFVIVDELMADKRRAFMNDLKDKITEERITIREMYKPTYIMSIKYNLFFTSNYKTPVLLEEQDRRFFPVLSKAPKLTSQKAKQLYDFIDNNMRFINIYLRSYDLSDFDQFNIPIYNSSRDEIIDLSRPELEAWLKTNIKEENGVFEADIISLKDIKNSIPKDIGTITTRRLTIALSELKIHKLSERISIKREKKTIYILRKVEIYLQLYVDNKEAFIAKYKEQKANCEEGENEDSQNQYNYNSYWNN